MEHVTRTRLISAAVLLLVLFTGFLMGLVWERRGGALQQVPVAEEVREPSEDPRSVDRDVGRDGHDGRRDGAKRERRLIVHRVDLSSEQERRVDSIVDLHQDRVRSLQRELERDYDARVRNVVMSTRESIRTVLTGAQRAEYDSLLAEHDRNHEDRGRRDDRNRRR